MRTSGLSHSQESHSPCQWLAQEFRPKPISMWHSLGASDWLENGHVTQFGPMRWEEWFAELLRTSFPTPWMIRSNTFLFSDVMVPRCDARASAAGSPPAWGGSWRSEEGRAKGITKKGVRATDQLDPHLAVQCHDSVNICLFVCFVVVLASGVGC